MTYVLGSSSAAALIDAGLGRERVIEALVTRIGLTASEADLAWWSETRRRERDLVEVQSSF
jgi:hypothetical protein